MFADKSLTSKFKCMRKGFLILFVAVLSSVILFRGKENLVMSNDVLLENVEALADNEGSLPMDCQMTGNVTCPRNGVKVEYVYENYSLSPNEEAY